MLPISIGSGAFRAESTRSYSYLVRGFSFLAGGGGLYSGIAVDSNDFTAFAACSLVVGGGVGGAT
jgi:hypothetical protein